MKYKKYIYILILLFFTLIALWAIPALIKKATYSPTRYPFMYYSSVLKELCFVDFQNKKEPLRDMSGNIYNTAEFDSIMPLLNYRQLMSDGKLPDSIDGHEITPQLLRAKSVVYRFSPANVYSPAPKLHFLFESMPKRVGLSLPPDVFTLDDNIQFIDAESNKVDIAKSETFSKEFEKRGFTFPAQWASGNPNPRKPYDEGYFCLDAKGQLFHLKMVNNRPFIRNTGIGDSIDIAFFEMQEVADKRLYGFLYDKQGGMYIIENVDGKYHPLRLDIDPLDTTKDKVTIMGNLLYWTVTVTRKNGMDCYALYSESLERIEDYHADSEPGKWDKVSGWIFPYYLSFTDDNTGYIQPYFRYTATMAFGVNFLLGLLAFLFVPNNRNRRIFNLTYIILTGIAGMIALAALPGFVSKKK